MTADGRAANITASMARDDTGIDDVEFEGIADGVLSRRLLGKVPSAEEAASLIERGAAIGMSGFTGAGYPKAVPAALARRIADATERGDRFRVSVWTGASTAPELDGLLA